MRRYSIIFFPPAQPPCARLSLDAAVRGKRRSARLLCGHAEPFRVLHRLVDMRCGLREGEAAPGDTRRLQSCLEEENLRNLRDRPHERPIFQGLCVSILQRRSRHHCQQLGDPLRVAGAEGSDATAEAVDGRAKAMQLDVVKNCSSRRQLHIASILSIGQPDVDWRPKRKSDGYFDAKRRGFGKLYPLVTERLKG